MEVFQIKEEEKDLDYLVIYIMKAESRSNISLKQAALSLNQAASLKYIRNSLSQVSSVERGFVKGKTKSPTGWINWTGESSPVGKFHPNSIKLPPIQSEIKKSSLLENRSESVVSIIQNAPIGKARGSIILEPSKLPAGRGSILIPNQISQIKSQEDNESENENYEENKIDKNIISSKQSLIHPDAFHPSNYISRCASKTTIGTVMGKKKKHNQDSWLIEHRVQGVKGQYLFAVCDGHGEKGHKVSSLIKKSLLSHIDSALNSTINPDHQLDKVFSSGLHSLVSSIESSEIDLKYSGSTLVSVLIRGKKLVCGNIGDSRGVIGQKHKKQWKAVDISNDHKPSREDEAFRVIKAGGVVRQFKMNNGESVGPLRVWSSNKDNPGLAMTRSVGDMNAKSYGIISDPEISTWTISKKDKFMILATDGIWELISSQEAVDIVKDVWKLGRSEACCDKLIEVALNRWESENISDDITVIVVFFSSR